MADPRDKRAQRELPFSPDAGDALLDALELLRERLLAARDAAALAPPQAPPTVRLVEPPPERVDEREPLRGTRSTTVYLSPPVRAAIKRLAGQQRCTLSAVLERACRELLEREAGR